MQVVAIVGRPNVGKSTLFNRLIGERNAIVEDTPGVTRDRIYGKVEWNGKMFSVIDTGGFVPGSENEMETAIREQAMLGVDESDVIVMVCDGRDGVTPFDIDIATILRRSHKPIVLVVNKCDNSHQQTYAYEFHSLGIGEPYPISSTNGLNTGDFLDAITDNLSDIGDEEYDERLKIAIVGRPNAGKSSLSNALLGENRSIVTPIPGTTRDAVDSTMKYYGEEIVLIDTAGLRRRSHVKENIEMFSILRTNRAIERCDVAIIMVDAERGIEEQDKKIINMVDEERKGMIVAINKWDLIEKETNTASEFSKKFQEEMRTFDYIPVVFISALTKQRITNLVKLAKEIQEKRATRIKTHLLNEALIPMFQRTPPPAVRGQDLRINYVTQVGIEPPVFAFFCNSPKLLPDSYKRFMERVLREKFDFEGCPVSFIFRRKNVAWEDREKQK
ncbi:MAG: ribosome biogenesis GTPase Der [Ignavibacteria bacterium]|jgi:GTP-binding protein|nr:ribosome biogenesis GTPase Der [Ignavibacteria bacterium]